MAWGSPCATFRDDNFDADVVGEHAGIGLVVTGGSLVARLRGAASLVEFAASVRFLLAFLPALRNANASGIFADIKSWACISPVSDGATKSTPCGFRRRRRISIARSSVT